MVGGGGLRWHVMRIWSLTALLYVISGQREGDSCNKRLCAMKCHGRAIIKGSMQ